MADNENNFSNPIERARAQANLQARNQIKTEVQPQVENTEHKTVEEKKPFPLTINAFNTNNEDDEEVEMVMDTETKVNPEVESVKDTQVQNEPAMTNLQSTSQPEPQVQPATQPEVNQEPKFDKPKKEHKEKPIRIINSNDAVITPEEISESRKYAWLAYILFFIPLLINKTNQFVRHNANEGLEIFIFDVIGAVLVILNATLNLENVIASFVIMLGGILGIGLLILTTITKIYMIIASALGKKVNTPWLWNFRLIK